MVSEKYQDLNVQNSINAKAIGADLLAAIKQAVFDIECPVGTIKKQCQGEQTPAEKYGMGTWTLDTTHDGRTEIGASTDYPLGSTGGEATHLHGSGTLAAAITIDAGGKIALRGRSLPSYVSTTKMVAGYSDNDSTTYTSGTQVSGNTGSASSLQPYLAVNYWKRVS